MKKFEDYFLPQHQTYPVMKLSQGTQAKIQHFVHKVVREKKKEQVHQIDGDMEKKRWFTGVSGELAVENYLGIRFFDWEVGDSNHFNAPDLRKVGLNIGIKTVEYGKFPVIHKESDRPEIIVIKKDDRFFICGLATVEVLNTYQDDNLILNAKLRARNVKTGFYGFEHLLPFSSFKDLQNIYQSLQTQALLSRFSRKY